MKNKVVIIGAGAAGLFAAMSAAENGADVVVLEKMTSPARKLAITGKGRCNLTTSNEIPAALKEFGKNGRFLRGAFSRFYSQQLIELLGSLGIEVTVERGQRIFPMAMRAPQVVERLLFRLRELGVSIKTGVRATGIETQSGHVSGVETADGFYAAGLVILCTGGA